MTFAATVPDFAVMVDGKDITPRLKGRVVEDNGKSVPRVAGIRLVTKRGGEADQLELMLDDSDGALALPPTGATIALKLGWASGTNVEVGLVDKGTYIVDAVEHTGPPDLVTIRARAADLTGAIRTRRDQSWHATTLGAIVRQIAARNKLKVRVAPALARIAVAAHAQKGESDMALLRRLGREHDAVATIKAGTLVFAPIGAGITASGKAIPGITLARKLGDRHSFSIERREDDGAVEAVWTDRKAAKRKTVKIGEGAGPTRRLTKTYASEAAARTAARAERGRQARAPMKLNLTLALARLDIYPERPATVTGFKAAIDAVHWIVADVTHELIGDRGFTTNVTLETSG